MKYTVRFLIIFVFAFVYFGIAQHSFGQGNIVSEVTSSEVTQCPSCGLKSSGNFCSDCGVKLNRLLSLTEDPNKELRTRVESKRKELEEMRKHFYKMERAVLSAEEGKLNELLEKIKARERTFDTGLTPPEPGMIFAGYERGTATWKFPQDGGSKSFPRH